MRDSRQRFLDLMKKEILKLDLADLDFGIYRILNYRRGEIERFFDEELPALLDEALTHEGDARRRELEDRVEELREALDKAATNLGFDSAFADGEVIDELSVTPNAAKYREAKAALEALGEGPAFAESEEDRLTTSFTPSSAATTGMGISNRSSGVPVTPATRSPTTGRTSTSTGAPRAPTT